MCVLITNQLEFDNSFNAFNFRALQLLEYYEDLDYYYKYGYGSEINTKVGCPIAKELMGYLK